MNKELFQTIFFLHKSIFEHAINTASGTTNVPLFSIKAPGHIGIDSIEASNLNLNFKSLPQECQNIIQIIFSTGNICKLFELENEGIKKGLIESFLASLRHTYLLSVVTNPINPYEAFMDLALHQSKCIAEWIENGTQSRSINIIIQPQVIIGQYSSIGKWSPRHLSIPELCIEGKLGFQSPQEACERVFASSFFKRELDTMPQSSVEILAEVDILILSLWLALGNIYRIQDVRFERVPWNYSPDENSPFGHKFQPFWDNTRESQLLQTFVGLNMKRKSSSFAETLTDEQLSKICKWIEILSANRKAIYSLNMVCDGIRDIARSVGEQSFRKDRIARDGIFKVISGLEGLNSDCKPIHKTKGHKTEATKTFIDCWSVIWRKSLLIGPENKILSKTQDIDTALNDIYSLRSDLAHSDPTSMHVSLQKVQTSCGNLFNGNQYDPSSVGMTIIMIVDELVEFFYNNENVLTEMLKGIKPN